MPNDMFRFRDLLSSALTIAEVRSINWGHVGREAAPAIEAGWSGESLANFCVGDLGPGTQSVPGSIVATLRLCANTPPPTPATPTPPHINTIQTRNPNASKNPTRWADAIRDIPHTPDTKAH